MHIHFAARAVAQLPHPPLPSNAPVHKNPIIKFHEIISSRSRVIPYGWTDRHDEAGIRFAGLFAKEKISWTVLVRNEKYYIESRRRRISYIQYKEERLNWIGHILRRNCLLKHVMQGKRRRGRRRKQLLDDFKEKKRYCNLK
jgi:hypothetical protein